LVDAVFEHRRLRPCCSEVLAIHGLGRGINHLVVLQVAGVSYGRQREQVYGALNDITSRRVGEAIKSLEAVGVVVVNGRTIRQSRALARVDRLGLIGA
jgi:hypothetical protein